MVRGVIADESFLNYLKSFTKLDNPTVGLILGQPSATKDFIVHFARTPPYVGEVDNSSIKKIDDISETWIADHARHATRMLPGGMFVLGIFIVSSEDAFTINQSKLKAILTQINKKLECNEFLYGNSINYSDKLILYYSSRSNSYVCKSYNSGSGLISAGDIKFQPHLSVKWLQLECKYELDQIFPIPANKANWSLKKHIGEILKGINSSLKCGTFFFDGEIKEDEDILETVGKKKKVPRAKLGHHDNNDVKLLQVTIIIPGGGVNTESNVQVIDCNGQIRLAGHVATKLWLHPKATIKEASTAIIQDISRSLAARLEMHLDSLIEEEHSSSEDVNSIHETPRRVFINLPSSRVSLSDYLFPGEGPQEAQISLKELLDIDISESSSILDIEGQADFDLCNEGMELDSDELLQKLPATTNKYIYFAGLGIAFLVLIISLLIHFIQH